jgi:hypothetical protein
MDLYLDGHHILLHYDGNESYKSTDMLMLDDTLKLQWVGYGLTGQQWKVSIQAVPIVGSAQDPKTWSKSGQIPPGPQGGSTLYAEIPIPITG